MQQKLLCWLSKRIFFSSLLCCIKVQNVNNLSMRKSYALTKRRMDLQKKASMLTTATTTTKRNKCDATPNEYEYAFQFLCVLCTVNDGECEKQEVAYYNQWMPFISFFLSIIIIIYSFDATSYAYNNHHYTRRTL